jgi:hypothetical protein
LKDLEADERAEIRARSAGQFPADDFDPMPSQKDEATAEEIIEGTSKNTGDKTSHNSEEVSRTI